MSEMEERGLSGPTIGGAEASGPLNAWARRFIELSPFAMVTTVDAAGNQDVGLYGGLPGFAALLDDTTLTLPNALADGRRTVLADTQHDARVTLVFLVPGIGEGLRVSGHGQISVDTALLERLTGSGRAVASALVIEIDKAMPCGGDAIAKARLWDEAAKVDRSRLPGNAPETDKTIEADYLSGLY